VAALRGHEVILYEKERRLGGLMPLAAMIKGTEVEDLDAITRYLKTQLDKLGVTVRMGTTVTPAVIEQLKPDSIVLAVGGVPAVPSIPGISNKIVLPASKLHRQSKVLMRFLGPRQLRWLTRLWMPLGARIVIIGGAIHGCELAEFLVKRGRHVTVVESSSKIGSDMVAIMSERLVQWLKKKGVTFLTDVKYNEITDKGLTITDKEGRSQTLEADNILIALPLSRNTELYDAINGTCSEIYNIGDCKEPHRIIHAVHDGSQVGRMI
jgi:2,4-dienoyl-CoA reductase (NADPH2)